MRKGKLVPKPTNRGPPETRLAEAERAQLAVYQASTEAAGAVRVASVDVRPEWRADICATAEEVKPPAPRPAQPKPGPPRADGRDVVSVARVLVLVAALVWLACRRRWGEGCLTRHFDSMTPRHGL